MEIIKEKLIAEGAEAKIYLAYLNGKKVILKERVKKRYRHEIIDKNFRKYRTRREAKILKKLEELEIPAPRLLFYDEAKAIIVMEYIEGERLSNVLEKLNYNKICERIGYYLSIMHENNIIHNDLTTSNILYNENGIYFIDFGLSFFSSRIEDKAVDIHLFREALESKHWKIFKEAFNSFIKGYSRIRNFKEIYDRFLDVERRGRYK